MVALLKKVGASNRLTYMIIGEALVNDGTALVLYNLLYALVAYNPHIDVTPMRIFIYFLTVIIASPLLGAAFGAAALYLMSIANRRMKEEDTTIQMAITLTCAYTSFYIAEYVCEVSGVICCCAAATVLARFASPLVLRPETLHSIWAAIEWVGNTVIFFLAGIIICLRSFTFITGVDVGILVLTYVGIFVIRFITVAMFYPALRVIGKGCTVAEAVFITWGGLRGAVSIALALSLVESAEGGDTFISVHDAHRVLFLVGGTAALTLLLNATTAGMVLKKLGLLSRSEHEEGKIMFHYARKTIRLKAFKLLEQVQREHPELIDPDFVINSCSIMRDLEDSPTEPAVGIPAPSIERRPSSNKLFTPTKGSSWKFPDAGSAKGIELPTIEDEEDKADEEEGGVSSAREEKVDGYTPVKPDMVRRMLHRAESLVTPMSAAHDDYNHQLTDTISMIASTRERGRSIYADNRKQYDQEAQSHAEDIADLTKPVASLNLTAEAKTDDIRRAFLNVVRVRYWRQINTGRLPRKSGVALTLLNSIDIALETTGLPGLQDWQFILMTKANLFKDVLLAYQDSGHRIKAGVGSHGTTAVTNQFDVILARHVDSSFILPTYNKVEDKPAVAPDAPASRRELLAKALREYHCSQAVYLLISFIEAQLYAQRKIPFYLGEDLSTTPEAALVIRESQEEVDHATRLLQHIHPKIARRQLSKLAVRWILHMEEDAIEAFQTEGVITEEQAELLFDEAAHDLISIRQSRWYRLVYYRLNQMLYAGLDAVTGCVGGATEKKQ